MGNPEADSSNFQKDQADYNVQIQYNVQVSYNDNSNDPAYYDPNPQSDQSHQPLQSGDNNDPNPQYQQNDAVNNQQLQQFRSPPPLQQQQHFQTPQQQQQQFQPPPPQQQQQHFQPPHQQQQQQHFQPPEQQQQFGSAQNAQSLSPQFNQPYSAAPPPQSVAQFPSQIPQMNPAYAKMGAYPPPQQPSNPPMAAAPQEYPPQQQQSAPQAHPPNLPLPKPYPPPPAYQQQPAAQPVPFPPPAGEAQYAAVQTLPMKPGVQVYGGAGHGNPMQANMMGAVNTEGWRTGLFDCMDDPTNAVITFLFPCLTFGQVAEIIDDGSTTCVTGGMMYALISAVIGIPFIYSCTYRSKLRNKFGLVESPAPDWIVHFLCEPCALCQEYRELNRRGLDPSIGWLGNLQRQQQMQQQPQATMMPPMNQIMKA